MPVRDPIVYSSQRDGQLAPLLHCGFLLVGIVHTLLGPILPMLAARWRLDDAEAGSLFVAQFMGTMIGSALLSPMIERLGSLRLMAFSYAAMAAAVASHRRSPIQRLDFWERFTEVTEGEHSDDRSVL